MSATRHEITEVEPGVHGWSALCSCGRWATTGGSEKAVRRSHADHVAEKTSSGR